MNIFFRLLTYFVIYSFFGWVIESTFRTICEKKLINTGFLHGPVCPIYGIGAIIMLLFLNEFENKPILLFFIAIIILTFWEYIVGVMLEKIFKTKYWDYSEHKFNFQGRICLSHSIFWGILGVVFVIYIHPFIRSLILKVDPKLMSYIISIIVVSMFIDMVITIVKVKNIKSTLVKIETLDKEIKEKLKEIGLLKSDQDKNISIDSMKEIVEKLKKKRNKTILHLYRNVSRLKKAFPAIDTKEITEVLNKKIEKYKEIRKKKKMEG